MVKTTKKKIGKPVSKDGTIAKENFIKTNFIDKGKTKVEAVAGLIKKYPDIALNYAKTIVYQRMRELWPVLKESTKEIPVKAKKTTNKVEKKITKKSKPYVRSEDEANEDIDLR